MAIQDAQKLDFLWKKIGYGFAKTDVNSVKAATNESIPSPLLLRGDTIWVDSDLIPGIIQAESDALVEVYNDSQSSNGYPTVEAVQDITASPNRTWNTNSINWIPPEFGSTYQIKVYLDNPGVSSPQTSGSQLFASGSGSNDEWFFDYKAGILNFIGSNLPSGISGKSIYVTGAVYIGDFGVKGQRAQFGNLILEENNIFVTPDDPEGDINLIANGAGAVNIQQSNLNLEEDLNVTGIANFDNVVNSTDITNGSVVVDGGVGIAKNLNLGGDANVALDLNVAGSVDIIGDIDFSGTISIDNRLFSINDLADAKNDPIETGQKNIALGFNSMNNVTSNANFNAVLGNDAAQNLTDGENNIILGNNAEPSTPTVNNEVTIGNNSTDKFRIPGVDFNINDGVVTIGDDDGINEENLRVYGSAKFTDSIIARDIDGNIDGGSF